MAFSHGHDAFFSLGGVDLSAFTMNISFSMSVDSHDVTTLGNDSHRKFGGLRDGTITIDGTYDNGAAGPRATIEPLLNATAAFGAVSAIIYRPEGTGAALPEVGGNVLVQAYEETVPSTDMITWVCTMEVDGNLTETTQI